MLKKRVYNERTCRTSFSLNFADFSRVLKENFKKVDSLGFVFDYKKVQLKVKLNKIFKISVCSKKN